MRVVIYGGGVIGLMQARELAVRGVEVILVDRSSCGKEASWAGGGIVSPLYPWRYSRPVTELACWSQDFYQELSQSLSVETGIDPEFSANGLLILAIDDIDAALQWAAQHQRVAQVIDSQAIRQLEPTLARGFGQALWFPQVGSIRNPRLVKALRQHLVSFNHVSILENCPEHQLVFNNGRVIKCVVGTEQVAVDAVIYSAGAWTGELLKSLGIEMDIAPVKGQMIAFDAAPGEVNRVVLSSGKYVIPRKDGLVLAGSTLEYTGFDKSIDESGDALRSMACELFPNLARLPVAFHWAGLRPSSPDGIPFISAAPGLSNLYINAGHFRNGLVTAPASVRLLTSIILQEAPFFDPTPYDPAKRCKVQDRAIESFHV